MVRVTWLKTKFDLMANREILIEEYGIGNAVAVVENGVLIDFLIDPANLDDCSTVGSIVTVRLKELKKGLNGRFVTLPNNKKGFLKGRSDIPSNVIMPVFISSLAEPHKAQPVSENLIIRGKYVILTPGKTGINFSRKIKL